MHYSETAVSNSRLEINGVLLAHIVMSAVSTDRRLYACKSTHYVVITLLFQIDMSTYLYILVLIGIEASQDVEIISLWRLEHIHFTVINIAGDDWRCMESDINTRYIDLVHKDCSVLRPKSFRSSKYKSKNNSAHVLTELDQSLTAPLTIGLPDKQPNNWIHVDIAPVMHHG